VDRSPDLIGATLGQYQIEALIGHGGMGFVYRARDAALARAVALKILPPEVVSDASRLSRFVQEARAASALNHPHVIAIYEIREATPMRDGAAIAGLPPLHYLAMELVTGDTLRTLIDARRLDMKRAIDLLVQVAEALSAAHAAGVVHRDLKPENIMVASTGYAKVLDFGLAKLRPDLPAADGATQAVTVTAPSAPGMLLGTVGYMSPEQVEGRPADHRSDVFAFGCVAYEAAAGSRAFAGPSTIETLHRIANVDPAMVVSGLTTAPAEFRRIVGKCLARDPDDRYQSLKETAIDLRGLLRQLESRSVVSAESPRPSTSARQWPLWLGAAALVVAVGVAAWAWFLRRPPASAAPAEIKIERITASGFLTHVALSPDGKYLAYTDNPGGRQSLWVRQVDGTNPLELIPPRTVGYWGIEFARDGASIFYAVKSSEDPGGALYQVSFLGGPSKKILNDVDSPPALSPDGRQLAYLRAEYPDRDSSALMLAGADGSNPRALAVRKAPEFFAPGFFVAPSWSPDGSRLVSPVRNTQTRSAALVTVGLAGDEAPLGQTFTDIGTTSWVDDGVVFVMRGVGGLATGNGGQFWLQPYPRGNPRRLTNDLIDYRSGGTGGNDKAIVSVGQDASPNLWTIPLDGKSEPRRLPSLRYDGASGVAWNADGRILFTTPVRGSLQIWSMDADGSNRRPLTTEGSSAWPSLSRDGRFVIFSAVRGEQRGVWRMNPDGTEQRLVAAAANATFFDTTPDGQWITFTSDKDGSLSLWRVPSAGGTPERIIERFERASLSPSGDRAIGVLTRGSRYGIAVLPLAGGEPEWIPSDSAGTGMGGVFQWAPDGKIVYFTTAERANLFAYRFGAPSQSNVTHLAADAIIFNGAISRDGRTMLVSRGAQGRDAFLITNFR
jgi:serine/threonine protein kinase/Tol biopolymer transport system component